MKSSPSSRYAIIGRLSVPLAASDERLVIFRSARWHAVMACANRSGNERSGDADARVRNA